MPDNGPKFYTALMTYPNGLQVLAAGETLSLPTAAVHLWLVEVVQSPVVVDTMRALLAIDEIDRASRFRFERDRRRYIVARGVLRCIVGRYIGERPDGLRFAYGSHGKPALAGSMLEFNVSHSDELALMAFAWERTVGVDLERIRPFDNAEGLAKANFSPSEYRALMALSREDRLRAFYNGWTRKEAFVKAIGDGLSYPLDSFSVSLPPDQPAALLTINGRSEAARRWSLHAVDPSAGYVAALACEGSPGQINRYSYTHFHPRKEENS